MRTTNVLSSTFANEIEVVQDTSNNPENIEAFILTIRGKQVLLDRDLAMLYNVETKRLNEQVKRNIERFPSRFRFQLSKEELNELVANCDRFDTLKHSTSCPYVFTEQGVAMLSTVLRSKTAVETSIKIMDAFVSMRYFIASNAKVFQRLESIEYEQLEMKRWREQANSLQLDINRHNAQYPPISIGIYRNAHDRFLIIDSKVYHIGASIKDLGKKIFGFSLMKDLDAMDLLNKIGVDDSACL